MRSSDKVEYLKEQMKKGKPLVTGDGGNSVRLKGEGPNKGAVSGEHTWGL